MDPIAAPLEEPASPDSPMTRQELLADAQAARRDADRQRQYLTNVFMQAPMAVMILQGDRNVVTLANRVIARIVGRSPEQLIGQPIFETMAELRGQGFEELVAKARLTGEPFEGREVAVRLARTPGGPTESVIFNFVLQPLRAADGTVMEILIVATEVTTEVQARRAAESHQSKQRDVRLRTVANPIRVGGVVTGAVVLYTDITEQDQALEARQRSEENFRNLAEAIPQQVWTATPEGSLDFVNQRVLSYFNSTREQVLGAGWQAVVHPEDLPESVARWSSSLQTKEPYEVEFRLRQADGIYRWHLGRAFASLDRNGNVVKWFGTNTDVDEAKKVREELERSRAVEQQLRHEAEQANRSKDEFLAMLGHELRNPLAPITTALQLMKLRSSDGLIKERTIIERQVNHLTRLVDDLLDISRITRGKIDLSRKRLELSTIIASAIEIASPLLEQRQHHLTLDVPPGGLTVEGDAVRLSQVVSNLLTNSAKYTEPGGHILVRAARDGANIVLTVKDNGIGIAQEMLPLVFDLFAQERQSIDRARGGLGLGLAIVRTLVTLHGGTVAAHSQGRDLGSEFTITLPAAMPLPTATELPDEAHSAVQPRVRSDSRRVLIVDDNIDAAELLATTLEFLGHVTAVAADGPSALLVAPKFCPDVAVLDIGLPVMDGYELARQLRQLPALAHLKLLALTGYGQESDRQRSSEAGFDAHLVKPVQIGMLEELLADSD